MAYTGSLEMDGSLTGNIHRAESSFDLSGKISTSGNQISGIISIGSGIRKEYQGEYSITPMAHQEQTLETADLYLTENITVKEIPFYKTSNAQNGITVNIGG